MLKKPKNDKIILRDYLSRHGKRHSQGRIVRERQGLLMGHSPMAVKQDKQGKVMVAAAPTGCPVISWQKKSDTLSLRLNHKMKTTGLRTVY